MYTEEQQYASQEMQLRHEALITSLENLIFLEEQLGANNKVVIAFRNYMKKYEIEYHAAEQQFKDCGGLDVILELLKK